MKLTLLLAVASLHVVPIVAAAQALAPREALKQGAPPVARAATCPPAPEPAAPTDAQRRRARDLAQQALQAALLGDSAAARDELREAAKLDATDADLAYRLGRAHEAVRASTDAVAEYCRFLTLAPTAPEAAEVRTRVTALTSSAGPDPRTAETLARFQAGVAAYEGGRFVEAEAAFGAAIGREPSWPEPWYNRAVTYVARGQREAAARDLEQFLRLRPETADRASIVARIAALRRATLSPTTALTRGLLLPGAGQYYMRRPLRAAITAAGVGVALAAAFVQRTSTATVEQQGTDPFGNPYTYTTSRRTRERPYALPGIVVGLALSVGSAVDAYNYAKRIR